LATADYVKKDFTNRYEHLTNYSVNKHNIRQAGDDSTGNSETNTLKLTLSELRDRLMSQFTEDQIKTMYSLAYSLMKILTHPLTHTGGVKLTTW